MKNSDNSSALDALSYKFSGPTEVPGAVQRTQILSAVRRNPHIQVICIQAPAGHGKSTILQQLAQFEKERGVATAWLTLDAADNDMGRFLQLFHKLINDVTGGGVQLEANDLSDDYAYSHDEQVIGLMSRVNTSISIFFDEFQTLRNANIIRFLSKVLHKLPSNMRVYLGGREIPNIGLSSLLVHNRALHFKVDAVRFSIEETRDFFDRSTELDLNSLEVDAIHKQTEGWPAAIQLSKLALEGDVDKSTLLTWKPYHLPGLAEYLADNILQFQTDKVKTFLQISCRLRRVSAELCDVVTGCTDSLEMLLQLEKQGLFLRRLGEEGNWFKYHTLFASYVEDFGIVSLEEAREVHLRAFHWFEEHGYMEEAMYHVVAIEEYGLACNLLDKWASSLVANAHLTTVEIWFERIPFTQLKGRLSLQIKIAWSLVFLRNTEGFNKIYGLIRKDHAAGQGIDGANIDLLHALVYLTEDNFTESHKILERMELPRLLSVDGFEAFECGAMCNMKGIFAQSASSFESAKTYLLNGRAYSDRGHASFSWAYSLAILGMTYLAQGQLDEAISRLRQGISQPDIYADESFSSISLIVGYAQVLYETNNIGSARKYLEDSISFIGKAALPDWLTVGYITLSKILFSSGEVVKAHTTLDELENIALCGGLNRVVRSSLWEKCRQHLICNNIEEALEIRESIAKLGKSNIPSGWIYFSDDDAGDSIGDIRLCIYTGSNRNARRHLDGAIKTARKLGRKRNLIKLYTLEAMLNYQNKEILLSHRSMLNAIRLAEAGGFLRVFCDEGDLALRIVSELHLKNLKSSQPSGLVVSQDYVEAILQAGAFDQQGSLSRIDFESLLGSLTKRELEILRLLVQGVPNKTIATKMYISSNTVKFHLKNIYAKLGVKNRTEAAARLQEMDLLGVDLLR